jgi:hypothetical protein
MQDPDKVNEALSMILMALFGAAVFGLLVATAGAIASLFNL